MRDPNDVRYRSVVFAGIGIGVRCVCDIAVTVEGNLALVTVADAAGAGLRFLGRIQEQIADRFLKIHRVLCVGLILERDRQVGRQ